MPMYDNSEFLEVFITKFQEHALWCVFNQIKPTKKNALSIYVFIDLRLFLPINAILMQNYTHGNRLKTLF